MLDGVEFLERESIDRPWDGVHAVIEIEIATTKQLAQMNLYLMPYIQCRKCIITYVDDDDVQSLKEQAITIDMLIRGVPQENLQWGTQMVSGPDLWVGM